MKNYSDFSSFTAATKAAPVIEVKEGYVTINGRTFFHRSLKSRKRVKAFIDSATSTCALACCFSERGNFLCSAEETDLMGIEIRVPDMLGFWIPLHELANWGEEEAA